MSAADNPVVDDIIEKAMRKCNYDNQSTAPTGFAKLHERLLRAGEIKGGNLQNRNRFGQNETWKSENEIEKAQKSSVLYSSIGNSAPSLKKEKADSKATLGKGWFDMEPMVIDEALKRDIKVIRMRNYLDAKRFYKNPDKIGKVLHTGTVIEGSGESRAARLTNKQRKQSLLEEVLADKKSRQYSKKKYLEIQKDKSNKKRTYRKPLRAKY